MLRHFAAAAAAVGILLGAADLRAHHAFGAEFDVDKPISLRGVVTVMEWVNPHSWIHIDVKGADGTVVNWMIEGGSPNQLLRLGVTKNALRPGMEIVVEGFQAKDSSNKGVGRTLAFADGRKVFLGDQTDGRGGAQR
jgi:hypothetical protein